MMRVRVLAGATPGKLFVSAIALAASHGWRSRRRPRRNRPISCCATGSPPIPPIRTSRPTSRARPTSRRPTSRPRSNICKIAAGSSRRALYQLGRAYAANRQLPEAHRRLAQGGRQGLDVGDGRTRRALRHRRRGRARTRPRRENCSSAPPKPAIRAASPILPRCPAAAARPPIRRGRASCWRRPPRPMRKRSTSSA